MSNPFPGWRFPYPARTVTGRQVISVDKPGQQIGKTLEELQEKVVAAAVSENDNATVKIKGNTLYIDVSAAASPMPDGNAQYQVLSWNGSAWVADWVRAHS